MSPLALAPAAFFAGILMFLAPCTLPIVPGYLAFIAGVPEQAGNSARRRLVVNALFFILGFSIIFVLFGTFAAFLGALLGTWRYALARLAGVLLIFFGLLMLGLMPSWGTGEWHAKLPSWLSLGAPQSSLLIGMLFALGWSPCIGPILGTILFLASVQATALKGAVLLLIFSLGLGLPFLLCALLLERAGRALSSLAALSSWLQRMGGIILIALGILMLGNWMGLLVSWGFGLFNSLGYGTLLNYL